MKILHVEIGRTMVGGPEQVVAIAGGLHERGHDCVVACPQESSIAGRVRSLGLPVRHLAMTSDVDVAYVWRLERLIRTERPDLVHVHSRKGAVLGTIAARRANVPCIVSRRVDNVPRRTVVWGLKRYAKRVVCISSAIHRIMLAAGFPADRLVTIRSAVDAHSWLHPEPREVFLKEFGLAENAVVIGVVAQLIARKGHRVLFDAVAGWLPPEVKLILFGDGPRRADIEMVRDQAGLRQRVIMAGHRNDMRRWMGNLDVLVHPATMEGLGVALLQAAAAGVPIIASNVGGIPEVVQDQVNGLLVPPGDVAALRVAVATLLGDPSLRRRLGDAGRLLAPTEFGVARMVDDHIALYREVMAEASSASGARPQASS